MKTAFLVYRPVMDYEESITPYAIADTKEEADALADKMRDWCKRQAAKLKRIPEVGASDEEWDAYDEALEVMRRKNPPLGIKELVQSVESDSSNVFGEDSMEYNENAIAILELPRQ